MTSIPIEELANHKGEQLGQSPWMTVTQDMIQAFADATGDHQWIHVDVERAKKEAPWGAPVAHGFLTMSLMPQLSQQAFSISGTAASINYGMNKTRLRHGGLFQFQMIFIRHSSGPCRQDITLVHGHYKAPFWGFFVVAPAS